MSIAPYCVATFDYMLVDGSASQASGQSATEDAPKCKICTLNCTLGETAVLNCIRENAKITQKEIAEKIRKSERTVKAITTSLAEKGIITRKNGRRNGWWEIAPDCGS